MNDAEQALTVLAGKLGLPSLAYNANGAAEVILGGGMSVYLSKVDSTIVEASVRLEDLDFADAEMMQAMLEANFLGAGTGAGRLAVDSDTGETIYCCRWHVGEMDATALEARFADFAELGLFWATEGGEQLRQHADALRDERERLRREDTPPPIERAWDADDEDGEEGVVMVRL
ncbi:MAG: type III secretion system chaperone [Paracoccaceae bacterium]